MKNSNVFIKNRMKMILFFYLNKESWESSE